MKKIGIIGAMEEEVEQIKAKMTWLQVTTKASMEFNEGKLGEKDVVVVRSGIGKVNAGICAQILIDDFGVDMIWNTGIAGSLKNEINIGDIVISTDALQHDMDATQFGYPLGQIPRMETLAFPADPALIQLGVACCQSVNPEIQVFQGRVVSGDQFVADAARKKSIVENFAGYCTEMEGAAIAQAAYLNKIPYVVIRAISDKADNSATMDYPAFEKQAIAHTVKLVEEMVKTVA